MLRVQLLDHMPSDMEPPPPPSRVHLGISLARSPLPGRRRPRPALPQVTAQRVQVTAHRSPASARSGQVSAQPPGRSARTVLPQVTEDADLAANVDRGVLETQNRSAGRGDVGLGGVIDHSTGSW